MFIAIPTGMNYQTERYPVVTFSLIGANTLVYLVSLIFFFSTGGESEVWIHQHLWLIPAQSVWFTYLTSMFVHSGFFHLLGNMIFLFLFGSCVEDLIGRWRFLTFYLIGGFVAELTYIAMSPEHFASPIPMGGASGAISTCMGIYLLLRASAEIEFKYFLWFFVIKAGEFEIPAWIAISFWFLKDLVAAILGMFSHTRGGGVAFGAHVGGFLAGLGMIGIYKWLEKNREQKENPPGKFNLSESLLAAAALRPEIVTNEMPTIFIFENGAQAGPFTLTQIQTRLARGEISRDAAYWSEGMNGWENILDLASSPM